MKWILDRFFGAKLQQETNAYLAELARAPVLASRRRARELLSLLREEPGSKITLGKSIWGAPVELPVRDFLKGHGLVTGATGSGKTRLALLLFDSLLQQLPYATDFGIGVLDAAKADLFLATIYLLQRRLDYLQAHDPDAARNLRRRVVVCDFSMADPVSAYNILSRWPGTDAEFLAWTRAEALMGALSGDDKLRAVGQTVVQKVFHLLSEPDIQESALRVTDFLRDAQLRKRILAKCRNRSLAGYFAGEFQNIPIATIGAVRRRLDALTASESVRLALSGQTSLDFRALQDDGCVVLIRCCGPTIAPSVRRLLLRFVIHDLDMCMPLRQRPECRFLWIADEAQVAFSEPTLRPHMDDFLRLSRSAGNAYVFVTQNLSATVPDNALRKVITTNIRWALCMRGEPEDCAFLKPVLPVTARKLKPRLSPFEDKSFYSIGEERQIALDEIAHLPDRVGYFWLKSRAAEAIQIETQELAVPEGRELVKATRALRRDPTFGRRQSRKEYERLLERRDNEWMNEAPGDVTAGLENAYKRSRGGRVE